MCSVAAGSGLYLHTLSPLKGGRKGGAALCLCVIKLFTLRHTQTVCACAVAQRELPRIYIFTSVEHSGGGCLRFTAAIVLLLKNIIRLTFGR